MLKLVKFINERGGVAVIPAIYKPDVSFDSMEKIFKALLEHEMLVTESINNIVDACLKEKDYSTHNFIQWYVSEQLEEEALARHILDKLRLIGNDKGGLYLLIEKWKMQVFPLIPLTTCNNCSATTTTI